MDNFMTERGRGKNSCSVLLSSWLDKCSANKPLIIASAIDFFLYSILCKMKLRGFWPNQNFFSLSRRDLGYPSLSLSLGDSLIAILKDALRRNSECQFGDGSSLSYDPVLWLYRWENRGLVKLSNVPIIGEPITFFNKKSSSEFTCTVYITFLWFTTHLCCLLFLASPLISSVIYDTLRASLKWNRWESLVQVSLLLRRTYIKLVLQFLACKFVTDVSLL